MDVCEKNSSVGRYYLVVIDDEKSKKLVIQGESFQNGKYFEKEGKEAFNKSDKNSSGKKERQLKRLWAKENFFKRMLIIRKGISAQNVQKENTI